MSADLQAKCQQRCRRTVAPAANCDPSCKGHKLLDWCPNALAIHRLDALAEMGQARAKDVTLILDRDVQRIGSVYAWAKSKGLARSYVREVLLGLKTPGPLILKALGLRAITHYRKM